MIIDIWTKEGRIILISIAWENGTEETRAVKFAVDLKKNKKARQINEGLQTLRL